MKKYSLKWTSPDRRYNIVLLPGVWKDLVNFCGNSIHRETGGILIGYYTDDLFTAVVTEITHPHKNSRSSYAWFYRGIAGLKQLLIQRWKEPESRYYLGEWHYHPTKDVVPSLDDMNQMVKISREENYNCRKPVMLIVGHGHETDRQMRAFVFPRGESMLELHS